MPTYSCHFSDAEAPAVDDAIKQSADKTQGRYIKAAILQRMEREGFLPGSERADIRVIALATAEVAGERRVFEVLEQVKKEALAEQAAKFA